MAKKKISKQENPPAAAAQDDQSEQMASLKALNNLLVRETVERREEIHLLNSSNQSLESKIAHFIANNERLEAEKSLCEDQMLAADLEREINILVLSLQLHHNEITSEMTQRLESMEKERKELITRLASMAEIRVGRAELETNLRDMQEEANRLVCEMGRLRRDLDAKREEADGLQLMMNELQMSNEEAGQQIGLLRTECDRVKKEKMEMEERFGSLKEDRDSIQRTLHELMEPYEDLKREMGVVVNERNEIERARNETAVEINGLQKEVSLLTSELSSNRGALERVLLERDDFQNDLDLEKEEGKRICESFMAEKASFERRLMTSSYLMEDLKRKMEEMCIDKDKMEQDKAEKEVAITELQKQVSQLGATISTMRESYGDLIETNGQLLHDLINHKDLLNHVHGERDAAQERITQLKDYEGRLQSKVLELEKYNREVEEELKRVVEELDGLMEERKERERRLESLIEERTSLLLRVDYVTRKMSEVVEEKGEMEQVKLEQEDQIKQLEKKVCLISTTASALQESCRESETRNNQLQADMSRILREKDVVWMDLDHQKLETEGLRSKVRELGKSHKEKQQELVQLKTEKDNLVEEMKERERCFELLLKAKDSIESSLGESQRGLKNLQIKAELAQMISQQTLSMLKHVAETMNNLKDEEKGSRGEDGIDNEAMSDEIRPFVMELEAIKKAYRSCLREVEDKNQELKSLHISVAKSKKWSLWTWLSSATTLFAAISVAYVAKGR